MDGRRRTGSYSKTEREGIDVALQQGVAFGRPKVQVTEEFKEVYDRWKAGEITAVKAMGELGVKKTTFYKLVKEYENDYYIIEETSPKR